MSAGLLEFGNLSLPWVTAESVTVHVYSTPYVLYDGRTIVAGITETGSRPTFNGVATGETFITDITSEIGSRHNLTVNDIGFGVSQIINFDYSYMSFSNNTNYYKYRLGFATENLS